MKRIYLTSFVLALTIGMAMAQDEYDALRYSQVFFGGTTRVASMAGSFGALGADFGSLSINPAGIGIFRSSEFTFTPAVTVDMNDATYLGNLHSNNMTRFYFSNVGFESTKMTGKETGFKSVSFGIGYNRLNNFNKYTILDGRMPENSGPPSSSYLDNFVNNANNEGSFNPVNLDPFYEQLAWYADLMYYDTVSNIYMNDINNMGYGQYQRQSINEYGGVGEFVFSMGANYGDVLYLGATFGLHQLSFHQHIATNEEDDLDNSDYFNSFTFNEYLDAWGVGLTGKLGLIYRPINLIRFGAAFHIPTYYWIREEFFTEMSGTFDQVSNTYENSPLNTSEYWLRTPYRFIGSVAIQLRRFATLNVDYELADYSIMNYDSHFPEDFMDVNQNMKEIYKMTSSLRAGAEVVLNPIYLRAGFGMYQSPYVEDVPEIDEYNLLYAGGIGFRSKKFFFDIGGTFKTNELRYQLYAEDAFGAIITGTKASFLATLGFRF